MHVIIFPQHYLHVHAKKGLAKAVSNVKQSLGDGRRRYRTRSVGGDGVGDTRADRHRHRHSPEEGGVATDSLLACSCMLSASVMFSLTRRRCRVPPGSSTARRSSPSDLVDGDGGVGGFSPTPRHVPVAPPSS